MLLPTSKKKLAKGLDFRKKICYNISVHNIYRGVAQLVAR